MMWKWKRPAAFLLAAAMIFTMPGIPVFAMETDTSAVHKGLCDHTSGFTDGVCNSCQWHCTHTEVSGSGVCNTCNMQMPVKVKTAGGTATYTTGFVAQVTTADGAQAYGSFDEAWNKAIASEGSTLKLLSDVTLQKVNDGLSVSEGSFTLDLNNKTLDGKIWNQLLEVSGTANITIKNGSLVNTQTGSAGSATPTNLVALEISGGTVVLENVNLTSGFDDEGKYKSALYITGGSLTVNGSTFTGEVRVFCENSSTHPALSIKDATLNNGILYGVIGAQAIDAAGLKAIFADGSMLFDQNSKYIDLTKEDYWTIEPEGAGFFYTEKCIVKPHTHEVVDGVCECGAAFAASVTQNGTVTYYKDFNAALAAANAGGTVKLLANADEITISSPLKLDLNGKTAAKLTVTGDVTLASLLPEGYAFKSGSTWISDLSGTELTNVSMAKIPIKSMDYPTEMSMTYGGAGTLLVNVKKETGTGAVSFQWYKVEDGKETAVGSATTKNQFDLSVLKLSAGNHTFRFSATCDGYKKMSQDIVVTVQKADIRSSLITPPTVQENLTYTGQEQALITAGSVTDYGTMQYSLTENGTYSQDIPTGTDAGTYTVWYRVIGDANHNDTAPASVVVSIGKKPLTITGVTAASKSYDGTTNADISSVTFDGVTLKQGTDYTVTASFDDASVGNGKNITATVTLMGQTAKNYTLEQSSFPAAGSITKAAAPDFLRETALVIVNGCKKTYTVMIPTLPALETPKELWCAHL